jgi:O-antigen ligase
LSVALSPRGFDRVIALLVGATVVAFAAGSSSVGDVKDVGLHARWIVLAALATAAAASTPSLRRLPTAVLLAAGLFVGLALVSSLWSVAPRLSAGRGLSVALLFATGLLLAAGASASRSRGAAVLLGLLGGAAAVALLGVLVLVTSYGTAVTPATIEAPPRFRGFGENPNTVPLLLTVALPIALAWTLKPTSRRALAAGIACSALFAATIVGAGSRGALLAAAVGAAATLLLTVRGRPGRAIALGAVAAAVVAGAAFQSLPEEASSAPPAVSAPAPTRRYVDVERVYPLDEDVGRPLPGEGEPEVERSFFGTSGRAEAWRGAAGEVRERPLLGFGFGTEAKAFVDRYYGFFGALPENSYLGIALQLGLAGLAALLALVAILAASTRRASAGAAPVWAAACAGVVAAGLAAAVVQSYLYSAGNIAAATFWIAAFMLPALAVRAVREDR